MPKLLKKLLLPIFLILLLITTTSPAQTSLSLSATDLSNKEITQLSALEVLDLKQKQQLSTEDYLAALIQQAEDTSFLNIFASLDIDLDANSLLEQTQFPNSTTPLHNIPIVISDNIDVAGLETSLGLPMLINHIPEQSADIINTLESKGALIMSKTLTTPLGINNYNQSVKNPYHLQTVAGGSQAGVAAAIAADLSPIGIGTDALGSARTAAALNGVIAFKPSHNRYSTDGIATTSSTETPALFTRSVKDIILVDSILSNETPNYSPAILKDLKVGIAQDFFYYPLDRSIEKLIAPLITKLIVNGEIEMIETEVNNLSDLIPTLLETLVPYELKTGVGRYLDSSALSLLDVLENLTNPLALEVLEKADGIAQKSYEAVKETELQQLQFEFNDFLERTEIEVFILPTTPLPATQLKNDGQVILNTKLVDASDIYPRNTQPSSFAGLPSITLPIGFNSEGLPVGIMLEGKIGDDARLLSIALAVEGLIGEIELPNLP